MQKRIAVVAVMRAEKHPSWPDNPAPISKPVSTLSEVEVFKMSTPIMIMNCAPIDFSSVSLVLPEVSEHPDTILSLLI